MKIIEDFLKIIEDFDAKFNVCLLNNILDILDIYFWDMHHIKRIFNAYIISIIHLSLRSIFNLFFLEFSKN